jgi:hypothetical protein
MRKGAVAGTITKAGYHQIKVDQVCYAAPRLAVFWTTGRWPAALVNHANSDRKDDSWPNLREGTHSQIAATMSPREEKRVPFKGVRWDESRGLYAAAIKMNYRTINLGRFDRAEQAHAAYRAAAWKLFGEFANTGLP